MTPFIEKMAGRAASAPKRIAFPEAGNPDVLRTAQLAAAQGMGWPVMFIEELIVNLLKLNAIIIHIRTRCLLMLRKMIFAKDHIFVAILLTF